MNDEGGTTANSSAQKLHQPELPVHIAPALSLSNSNQHTIGVVGFEQSSRLALNPAVYRETVYFATLSATLLYASSWLSQFEYSDRGTRV